MTELEQLKSQLAEMSAKIADMETEKEKPVELWQPQGGSYYINTGKNTIATARSCEVARLFGLERNNKHMAENALAELRRYARWLALRDELSPGHVFTINGDNKKIYFDPSREEWDCVSVAYGKSQSVYFDSDGAKKTLAMLNSGKVVL